MCATKSTLISPPPHTAFVALGGNLGNPKQTFITALKILVERGIHMMKVSPLYVTEPLTQEGYTQPNYHNAVIQMNTKLSPHELLSLLLNIEKDLGRVRVTGDRYSARTLDLDILIYGQLSIHDNTLTIPHPRIHERLFVLRPLCDIYGDTNRDKTYMDMLAGYTDHTQGILSIEQDWL